MCDTFAAADLSDEAILAADANPAEVVRRVTRAVRPPVGSARRKAACTSCWRVRRPWARRSPGSWRSCRTGRCSPPRARTGTGTSGAGTWSW
ncbi:hypothetical protein ACGFZQ_19095 [Streptomyces sp. NPDC048254]|uniref:NACHT N-terminal Helical domain 1-containing protein n=1 Tax=Streptomyces sp. NPDC048254 TaxID=3365525 RepID=UPI003714757E